MPERKIPKNYRSVTGTFPSHKNKRNIFYESLLERDFYLLLEFEDDVVSYEEQPFKIYYQRAKSTYRYTPDVLVHYNSVLNQLPCVFEVKMSDEIKEKKVFFEEKFNQIEKYINLNDLEFKMFTELDMDEIYLENAMFLYRYRDLNNQLISKNILEKIKLFSETSINNFLEHFSSNKFEQIELLPYIWQLIFLKKINTDMNIKITNSSIIKAI
ncbi:MAG: TnsA endonuclease N-terminal domain-containing protein [Arcobacter sp.]|uniref:TnsA endonuclease N-terminal domain-containing protein n=1 Tax=Arcobacter sp. TaxID=1872629 RepID=UPI003CFFC493